MNKKDGSSKGKELIDTKKHEVQKDDIWKDALAKVPKERQEEIAAKIIEKRIDLELDRQSKDDKSTRAIEDMDQIADQIKRMDSGQKFSYRETTLKQELGSGSVETKVTSSGCLGTIILFVIVPVTVAIVGYFV